MPQCYQLDEDTNCVIGVVECDNEKWCGRTYGGKWFKNNSNKFIGLGYIYHTEYSTFSPPKPYESWTLDSETFTWNPPTPRPSGTKSYTWNEETKSWDEVS